MRVPASQQWFRPTSSVLQVVTTVTPRGFIRWLCALPAVDWAEACATIDRVISLDAETNRLNGCELMLLHRAKVPTGLYSLLRKLVDSGQDEYATELTFLLELARSSLGSGFSRDAKRMIEKAATGLTIGQECRLRIAQEIDDIAHPKSPEELEERFKARAG